MVAAVETTTAYMNENDLTKKRKMAYTYLKQTN